MSSFNPNKKIATVLAARAEPARKISTAGAGPSASQKKTLMSSAAKITTPPTVGTARLWILRGFPGKSKNPFSRATFISVGIPKRTMKNAVVATRSIICLLN
jgi:hypothetical protein